MLELLKALTPIIVCIIGLAIPIYKLYTENKKLKSSNVFLSEKIEDLTISLQLELQTFNGIKDIAENILHNTRADRFLILTATNGTKDMRFATAVYEHHKTNPKVILSLGATGKYIKFEFDSCYKKMLKDAELYGSVDLVVDEMEDCDLKYIYDNEEVKHSKVNFLFRGKIDDKNDRLFYSSIATHDKKKFSKKEDSIIKMNIDKLKYLLNEKNN